jgi:hypothetical protein
MMLMERPMELSDVGFDRSKTEPLPGTVKFYQCHLFVCTGHAGWPAKIEAGGSFLQALWEAITPRVPDMPLKVKMTACDEVSLGQGYDLLLKGKIVTDLWRGRMGLSPDQQLRWAGMSYGR